MVKIIDTVNKGIQRIKLAENRALTNFGLLAVTRNRKKKDLIYKKNVSYGNAKLQKYDVIVPKIVSQNSLPVVFYVHGGSWCGGDKYGYTMYCSNLAKQGYIVVNCNYRLLPKVKVETCIDDIVLAINHFQNNCEEILKSQNIETKPNFEKVFFVGDSAGAHITSLIAGKATSGKLNLNIHIAGLGLYYGVYAFENIAHDPSPIMTNMDGFWKSIGTNTEKLYKEISTTNFVTERFPPTFLTSGAIDKLHYHSEVLFRLLKYTGIDFDYLSFKKSRQDARHAFLNAPILPSAKEAFERMTKFFEKYR